MDLVTQLCLTAEIRGSPDILCEVQSYHDAPAHSWISIEILVYRVPKVSVFLNFIEFRKCLVVIR